MVKRDIQHQYIKIIEKLLEVYLNKVYKDIIKDYNLI